MLACHESHSTPDRPDPDRAFAPHDDLKVVGRELADEDALTLTSVIRNEMYYLPSFLDHYRKLGVERFARLARIFHEVSKKESRGCRKSLVLS